MTTYPNLQLRVIVNGANSVLFYNELIFLDVSVMNCLFLIFKQNKNTDFNNKMN